MKTFDGMRISHRLTVAERVAHLKVLPAALDTRVNDEEQRRRTLAVDQCCTGQRPLRTQAIAKPLDEGSTISRGSLDEVLLESVFYRQETEPAGNTGSR